MIASRNSTHLSPRGRRRSSALSEASLLVTTAVVVWASLGWLEKQAPFEKGDVLPFLTAAGAASLLLCLGAVLVVLGSRIVLPVTLLAWAAWGVPLGLSARTAPSVAFLGFAWAAITTYFVVRQPFAPRRLKLSAGDDAGVLLSPTVLISGFSGLLLAGLAVGYRLPRGTVGPWAVLALLAVPAAIATAAEWVLVRYGRLQAWKAGFLTLATAAGLALSVLPSPLSGPGVGLLILAIRVILAVIGAVRAHELHQDLAGYLWRRPALLVVLTFVALSTAGGIVLKFPACTTRPIPTIDALFTSVSASCVTGLTVLDTPADFTFTGQLVILVLIQVGGLGIMTLSALATILLGRAFASAAEQGLAEVVGAATPGRTIRLVRAIAISTLGIEAAGALILFPAFVADGGGFPGAAWKAVFHSVSAFCNAGFALQSDNLFSYRGNPWVLFPIGALIVLGGLGFGVLMGLHDLFRRRERRTSLHSKLVLSTTSILVGSGFLLFLLLEWQASLSGLTPLQKINNALFQSITHRTAGFNSVDFARVGPATVLAGLVLMFIGASPSSTGGGVKTTTAAVLVLAVRAVLSRAGDVEAFGRRIPVSVVYRAAAVTALSSAFIAAGTVVLLQTQNAPFASLLFEAVSAFGTVGLSLGATTALDPLGKIVIMTLMLAGRTGPLTMVLLFHQAGPKRLKCTAEEVMVG